MFKPKSMLFKFALLFILLLAVCVVTVMLVMRQYYSCENPNRHLTDFSEIGESQIELENLDTLRLSTLIVGEYRDNVLVTPNGQWIAAFGRIEAHPSIVYLLTGSEYIHQSCNTVWLIDMSEDEIQAPTVLSSQMISSNGSDRLDGVSNSDGSLLVTTDRRIIDLEQETVIAILGEGQAPFRDIAFSTDGTSIAAVDWQDITLWNAQTFVPMRTFQGHSRNITDIEFPNEVISASFDNTIHFWNPETGLTDSIINGETETPTGVIDIELNVEQNLLAYLLDSRDKGYVVDLATSDSILEMDTTAFELKFSPNGRVIVTRSFVEVSIWDIEVRRLITKLLSTDRTDEFTALELSPNSELTVVGRANGKVELYDMAGNLLFTLDGGPYPITDLTFSPEGTYLVATSSSREYSTNGGELRIWAPE